MIDEAEALIRIVKGTQRLELIRSALAGDKNPVLIDRDHRGFQK